jgi:hypothetical protein
MLSGSSRKLKSRLQIAIGGMWFCILTMLSHRQGFDDVEQLKQKALEQARLYQPECFIAESYDRSTTRSR